MPFQFIFDIMPRIFAEVYGCSSNFSDCEIALGMLRGSGFDIVDDLKKSDLNIIFTCTVKVPTLNRMIFRIRQLSNLNKPLIVAGCMTKTERRIIEGINPKASLVGPNSIQKIVDVANRTMMGKKIVCLEDASEPKVCLPKLKRNQIIGIVQISTGCLSNCSYCSVKYARGKLFSYSPEMIVSEARSLIREGCKEIWLASQDGGCYGIDEGVRLPELLEKICNIDGKFFIRVGMMNPLHVKRIADQLIDAYKNEKVFKFLHLPVESGSDDVLNAMNRGYKVKDFVDIVDKFKKSMRITLCTDVIVGFPTESDEDFDRTMDLIERIKPDIVNISKFGARPGTPAAGMKQLQPQAVNARSKKLFELVKKIALGKNKEWIGWKGDILVTKSIAKDTFMGSNFAYKPTIVESSENLIGKFVNVEIIGAKSNYLLGKLM